MAQDYSAVLQTENTTEEVFNCINNFQDWWSGNFEGSAKHLDDSYTVRFGETYITMKVTTLIPNRQIEWLVTDCYKHWIKDKKEWVGTRICWDLKDKTTGTEILFTHFGLVPGIECYNGCVKGWGFYLNESLLKLINEGKGQPS